MRKINFLLVLLAVCCLTIPAFAAGSDAEFGIDAYLNSDLEGEVSAEAEVKADADDEDSSSGPFTSDHGPVIIFEYTALNLPGDDDLKIFRIIPGYTLKDSGIQLGANLTYFGLDRPSVNGKAFTEGGCTPSDDSSAQLPTYTLKSNFNYWGGGPSIGLDVELIENWVGLEFLVNFTFPFTNSSAGWSFEASAFAYFSLQGLTNGYLDLALMAGGGFGHYDQEANRYAINQNMMMPAAGLMFQF